MLTFFRANTPFHIFSILVVLLLLKLPFILGVLPVLGTELEWMLVGERLNNGHSLYQDVWTNVGPLSSYFYGFVDFMIGRNQYYYELVALAIIFFQSLLFTHLINGNQVFLERNYIPGLLYAIIMSLSFDANKLSPPLLATTFLLLAMNGLFKHIDKKEESTEPVFELGLFIGIGSLFSFPFSMFILWALLSLLMFTSVKFKQIMLLLLGFLLPLFIMMLFFYFIGNLDAFYYQWLSEGFGISLIAGADSLQILLIYALPTLLAFLGVLKVMAGSRYSNYQSRKHQTLVLSGMFGVVCYFLSGDAATYQLLCLSPFLAFFIAGWFVHFKGTAVPETIFIGFVAVTMLINAQGVISILGGGYSHLESLRIEKTTDKSYIVDKSILITGVENDEYFLAKPGSAYLNWELSKYDLENPNVYESLLSIHANFENELPEYIIDNEQVFLEIFRRMPDLGAKYVRVEGTRHFRLRE